MQIIVKTLQGLEDALADEMQSLGLNKIVKHTRAVSGDGYLNNIYRLNMCLQTGIRVLLPLAEFQLRNPDNLYYESLDIPWEQYFTLDDTFAIHAKGKHNKINHSGFAALRVKDGIADRFRRKFKSRPNVDTKNPDIRIELQFNSRNARILLDASGDSLHKRGYKIEQGIAPISEVLAAGLLRMMDWKEDIPLLDPMCGSGTFSIEAAMMATNSMPQFHRQGFTCRNWKNYSKSKWQMERDRGMKRRTSTDCPIYCYDKGEHQVAMARTNSRKAGVAQYLNFDVKDFFELQPPETRGFMILNPPYGERIEKTDITTFYKELSDKLKHDFPGWRVGLLSGSEEGVKSFSLRPSRSFDVLNGEIPCKFQIFELYEGKK